MLRELQKIKTKAKLDGILNWGEKWCLLAKLAEFNNPRVKTKDGHIETSGDVLRICTKIEGRHI